MWLWRQVKLKFAGQTGTLETQRKVDVADLIPKTVYRLNFCLGGPQSFFLRPSNDWMRATHIMENNLLYPKSTSVTFLKYLYSLLLPGVTRQLGAIGYHKLTHKINHHTNISREKKTLWKNQKEMLEINNIVTEMKNIFDGFINTLEERIWAWKHVNRDLSEIKRRKRKKLRKREPNKEKITWNY